jgi:hypothetical protein
MSAPLPNEIPEQDNANSSVWPLTKGAGGRGSRVPPAITHLGCRLLLVRGGAAGSFKFLHILRCQFRRIKDDGHLVDLASEVERHLVVAIIHRVGAAETNAERNVEGLNQRKGCLQLLGRHYVAVHLQRTRAAAADTARIVVSERRLSEPIVFEVVLDRMPAGGQCLRSLLAGPLEVEQESAIGNSKR